MSAKPKQEDIDSDEEDNQQVEAEEPVVEEDATLTNPDVVTKYQEAAKIAQDALQEIIKKTIAGAKIGDICKFGDEYIESRCATIFNKKNKAGKIPLKGVAFPVCLSVNECVCHVSPLESDDSYPVLATNDMVKIDVGVHIDGFIAVVAHTHVVGIESATTPEALEAAIGGARGNAINAAWIAAEVTAKLIKAGNTNHQITKAIKKVTDAFGVNTISGTLMHQMKQYVIDGNKMILLRDEPDQKVEAQTFEAAEVFAVDIVVTTGEGKPRETGARTTVYKRAVDKKYNLKNKASRALFNEINKKYPTMPFTVRALPDEKNARLGIRECVNHELLVQYPVLYEKKDDIVAHVKLTVLLLPSGTVQITGLPPVTVTYGPNKNNVSNDFSVLLNTGAEIIKSLNGKVTLPEDIQAIVNEQRESKKSKKAAKKAAAAAEGK